MDNSQLIKLPSEGLPYEGTKLGASLIDGNAVKIRPYNNEDSHEINVNANDSYTFYRTILSRLVTTPELTEMDPMLVGDAITLLVNIKLFAFGPNYDIPFQCENDLCNQNFSASVNVAEDFHMRTNLDLADEFGEFQFKGLEFKVANQILRTDHILTMHLPTILDEKKITDNINLALNKKTIKSKNFATSVRYRLVQFIDKVDGESMTTEKKLKFFGQFHTTIFEEIAEFINAHDVGFVDGMMYSCPHCSYGNNVRLNIGPKFFRPAARSN